MLKIKSGIFVFILSIGSMLSNSVIAAQSKISGSDFSALESQFPKHFTGFADTNFDDINVLRSLGFSQSHPAYKSALEFVSQKLQSHGETFTPIRQNIDQMLATQDRFTALQYFFVLTRISLFHTRGSDEEEYFFKGAGFSQPYTTMRRANFEESFKTFEEFLALFKSFWGNDQEAGGDFSLTPSKRYFDDLDHVDENYVKKGPFHKFVYPLIGREELGFFYLAWTYYQGIHPVPYPLVDNSCELHGIKMSRFGKVCHDLAHSDLDRSDHSALQFAYYLASYYAELVRDMAKHLEPHERRKWSLRSMLPHISAFVMSVHNLYRQSLLDILALSLKELDPRRKENLAVFETFSVGSFVHAHENPADLSQKYGTPILSELLKANVARPQPLVENEKKLDSDADLRTAQENEVVPSDIFKTSYTTGVSPFSDEEIFNRVKVLNRNQFFGHGYRSHFNLGKIEEDQVEHYEVHRNKFYIEVRVFVIGDIDAHIFRQATNYSNRLNFTHDKTILEPARDVLKMEYNYELPPIPSVGNFPSDVAFEEAAKACKTELNQGMVHLMDKWLKTAIYFSESTDHSQSLSIAERYKAGYDAALTKLSSVLPSQLGNLQYHINMAVHPDIISNKIKPKLSPEEAAPPSALVAPVAVCADDKQATNDRDN